VIIGSIQQRAMLKLSLPFYFGMYCRQQLPFAVCAWGLPLLIDTLDQRHCQLSQSEILAAFNRDSELSSDDAFRPSRSLCGTF
jgi:hypothetical protein